MPLEYSILRLAGCTEKEGVKPKYLESHVLLSNRRVSSKQDRLLALKSAFSVIIGRVNHSMRNKAYGRKYAALRLRLGPSQRSLATWSLQVTSSPEKARFDLTV